MNQLARVGCRVHSEDFEFDDDLQVGQYAETASAPGDGEQDMEAAGEEESKGHVDSAGEQEADDEADEVRLACRALQCTCVVDCLLTPRGSAHQPQRKATMLASDDRRLEADADGTGADPEKLFNMMRVIDSVLARTKEDTLVYQDMTHGKPRQLAAECFFKLLKLKSMDVVDLQQDEPFADIVISKTVRSASCGMWCRCTPLDRCWCCGSQSIHAARLRRKHSMRRWRPSRSPIWATTQWQLRS